MVRRIGDTRHNILQLDVLLNLQFIGGILQGVNRRLMKNVGKKRTPLTGSSLLHYGSEAAGISVEEEQVTR